MGVFGLAELGSALPAAGGSYTLARRALGPWGGYATGIAVLIGYAIAPAAIATSIGAYVESLGLFGITDGWWVYLAVYAVFIGVHLMGVGEALKVDCSSRPSPCSGCSCSWSAPSRRSTRAGCSTSSRPARPVRRRSCRTACSGSGPRSRSPT